jgi:hypothetical protein
MKACEFINEGYKEAETDFSKEADIASIRDALSEYKNLVNKNQVVGNERNIDYWRKMGWNKFKKFIDSMKINPSGKDIKQSRNIGKSITLIETDDWLIVIPLDKDSNCFHGKNTDWCTTKHSNNLFSTYFYDLKWIIVYCINKVNIERYAMLIRPDEDKIQLFDKDDNKITAKRFRDNTGFDPMSLKISAINHSDLEKGRKETQPDDLYQMIYRMNSPDPRIEKLILKMKNPEMASSYASEVLHRRWRDAEPMIMKNAKEAMLYAKNVIGGRWPEAESFILSDPKWGKVYKAQQGIK